VTATDGEARRPVGLLARLDERVLDSPVARLAPALLLIAVGVVALVSAAALDHVGSGGRVLLGAAGA
jgi:hypothetical protein